MSSSAFQVGNNPRSLYYFYTRLLPGIVLLLGLGVISPREFILSFSWGSLLLISTILSFVTGQFVHSLAAGLERTVPSIKPHREYAYQLLGDITDSSDLHSTENPNTRHQFFWNAFKNDYEMILDDNGLDLDVEAVYVLVRSRIELDGRGRTLQYQALILFSRNMGTTLLIVGIFLIVGSYLTRVYTPLMPQLSWWQLIGIIALIWISGIGLLRRNEYYKQLYADYLVMDFCNLATMTDPFNESRRV